MRLRWLALGLALVAGPSAAQEDVVEAATEDAQAAPPDDDSIAAIALPEQQLRGLLARVVFGTRTMGTAAEAMGIDAFCAATLSAVDAAVGERLPAWRANLVKAYRDNIPPDLLAKAVAEDPAAAAVTLRPHMDAVGAAMNKASSPLLKQAAAEVLEKMHAEAAKYDIEAVDMEKRVAELKAGAKDGSTFCGLLGRPGGQP